jgi:hypothetical protein
MKNLQKYTGELVIVERMKSSVNGNPRYKLFLGWTNEQGKIDGVCFVTGVDSSHCCSIRNYEGQTVTVEIGEHRGQLTLNDIKKV